jgi:hypothetical protein
MNRSTKSLSLRKETLVALTDVQLDNAVGGFVHTDHACRINDTVYRPHETARRPSLTNPSFGTWRGHSPFITREFTRGPMCFQIPGNLLNA